MKSPKSQTTERFCTSAGCHTAPLCSEPIFCPVSAWVCLRMDFSVNSLQQHVLGSVPSVMSGRISLSGKVFWQPFGFTLLGSTCEMKPPQKAAHLRGLSFCPRHAQPLMTTTGMTTCDASHYTSDFQKFRKREKPWVGLASCASWIFFSLFTTDPLGVRDECVWTASDLPAASDIYCRVGSAVT